MSVRLYFGLPGCGKTTTIAKFAYDFIYGTKLDRLLKLKRYDHVYSNVDIAVDGVVRIDNDCVGKYMLENCAILIDEATLFADSRGWKVFDENKKSFFLTHRHYRADVYLFTQRWDAVDLRIKSVVDRVYYMYKTPILGMWYSKYYRIPYGIIIPDAKKGTSEKLGEIIQGYRKPSLIVRMFAKWIYRPKYYKYFDSFEVKHLPPLPKQYKPYRTPNYVHFREWIRKPLVTIRAVMYIAEYGWSGYAVE